MRKKLTSQGNNNNQSLSIRIKKQSIRIKKQKFVLIMLAPAILLIFTFSTIPLVGLWMAFTKYRIGRNLFKAEFVGINNFLRLFTGTQDIGYLLRNTLIINVFSIILGTICALAFALFLKELQSKIFSKAVQTVSFFPFFLSWIVAYSVVIALFSVNTGAINMILVSTGIIDKGFNFLGREKYAYGLTIILNLWKGLGYSSILYLAAMGSINPELYDASAIDGASRFGRIWHITIPGVIPTMSILLILSVGNLLASNLDYFFVFTNITNWRRMETFSYYIYDRGLRQGDFSYATAVGIMMSLISIVLLYTANKISAKFANTSIF